LLKSKSFHRNGVLYKVYDVAWLQHVSLSVFAERMSVVLLHKSVQKVSAHVPQPVQGQADTMKYMLVF